MSEERSYTLAAELDKEMDTSALYWNTRVPYDYIRFYRTPDGVQTVIVGGKDHEVGHGDAQKSYQQLVSYTKEHFPVRSILYSWSAQHYDSSDSLPLIGKSPFSSRYYIATGFSGDGLVFGTAAGSIISDLISGKENKFADLYNPSRFKLSGITEFTHINLHNAEMLLEDRLKMGKDANKLSPDEASVSGGINPIAAYRDPDGNLYKRSAVCSHLHCMVRHNNAEKTWDCPCHGSRYTADGQIIEGPALKGLEEK